MSEPVELAFSRQYDAAHARRNCEQYRDGLARRLSHWRDVPLARRIFLHLDAHGRVELALPDLERSRSQMRRHLSWGAAEWGSPGYGHRQACGLRMEMEPS